MVTLGHISAGADSAREWERWLLAVTGSALELSLPTEALDARADWAESGVVLLTGRHNGPPVVPPGGAATAARVAGRVFNSLSARAGRPLAIDGHRLLGERAALLGLRRRGPRSPGGSCRAVQTADGWCAVSLARPTDHLAIPAVVERADLARHPERTWSALKRWASGVSAPQMAARMQLLGVPCGVIAARPAASTDAVPPVSVSAPGSAARPKSASRRPVVVDLSALWAGPLCAQLLGVSGARIIKVESTDRLDGARRGPAGWYRLLHGGHQSVLLDLQTQTGRENLLTLVQRADIVIDSSRPRAMEQFGIDVDSLCRQTPVTWVSITAYGRRGGWANRVGFGDDVAMAAGIVAQDTPSAVPLPCGDALADPLAGLHAAVVALAAYQDGGGRLVEVSMYHLAQATLRLGNPAAEPAQRLARAWVVPVDGGHVRVLAPQGRRALAAAARPGADTARVVPRLGRL